MIRFITTSPEQTEKFGREFAKSLCGGDVIALTGDLGAGKTCLTRGIADYRRSQVQPRERQEGL